MCFFVLLMFINLAQAQQNTCICSCCTGAFCSPVTVGSIQVTSCTTTSCIENCRLTYYQCQAYYQNGVVSGQCSQSPFPLYSCRCECCNTGSPSCVPAIVGYSTAFVCQTSACSISCAKDHSASCVSNYNGQTVGTCVGLLTTTATTTTTSVAIIGPGVYSCTCRCCQNGANCNPYLTVGAAAAYQCSPAACTQACQLQYPALCPSSAYLGQTAGTCSTQIYGNTRCQCRCCAAGICPIHEISTTGNCESCPALCRQSSVCGNVETVYITCPTNKSKICQQSSFALIILTVIMLVLL